jgi:hypothetical protein
MECPRCQHVNAEGIEFCTCCHQTLLYKCPQCWHLQAHSGTCEKCGCNFALYWGSYLERTAKERDRVEVERIKSELSVLAQILLIPLTGGRALVRFVLGWLASRFLSR